MVFPHPPTKRDSARFLPTVPDSVRSSINAAFAARQQHVLFRQDGGAATS